MEYENCDISKPDKKQWLPIYGIFKIVYDLGNKPTIIDNYEPDSLKFYGIELYHAAAATSVIAGIIYGLSKLL